MNRYEQEFFAAAPSAVTSYLAKLYRGHPEGEALEAMARHGATAIELPYDYHPRRAYDPQVHDALSRYDFVISYHGTSTALVPNAPAINLQPRANTGHSNWPKNPSDPTSVYFGQLAYLGSTNDCVKNYAFHAARKNGGQPHIVRAILPVGALLPDEDSHQEDWLKSLTFYGTVRVQGAVYDNLFGWLEAPRDQMDNYYETHIHSFHFHDFARRTQ